MDEATNEELGEPPRSPYVVNCTLDEVPHLSDEQRKELWDAIPEWEREARFRGSPFSGRAAEECINGRS